MASWLKSILLTVASVVATLLVLEVAFQLLPVNDSLYVEPVTPEDPVPNFRPDRDITVSAGWDMHRVRRHRVNNHGFLSGIDYNPHASAPLLAVIGDSYVEAQMVPYEETIQGRLAAALSDRARVYGFGISGAPLSTYLVYAQHARDVFGAEGLVFVIVGNDFDESLVQYKSEPIFTYFRKGEGDQWALETVPYSARRLTRILRKSAFLRYVMLNLQVMRLFSPAAGQPNYVANTAAEYSAEKLALSREAVAQFLGRLPEIASLPPSRIAFVVDGIRQLIYGEIEQSTADTSYFHAMRSHFIRQARGLGYEVIDMQEVFAERHRMDGSRFEFPDDDHWSGIGHGVAANALIRTGFVERLVPGAQLVAK